jgi:hypothetical protein
MITAALSALIVSLLALMGVAPGPATIVAIVVTVKVLVVAVLGGMGVWWVRKRDASHGEGA